MVPCGTITISLPTAFTKVVSPDRKEVVFSLVAARGVDKGKQEEAWQPSRHTEEVLDSKAIAHAYTHSNSGCYITDGWSVHEFGNRRG